MRPPLFPLLAFTSLALLRGGSGVAALDIDVDATVRKQEDLDAKWGFEVRLYLLLASHALSKSGHEINICAVW